MRRKSTKSWASTLPTLLLSKKQNALKGSKSGFLERSYLLSSTYQVTVVDSTYKTLIGGEVSEEISQIDVAVRTVTLS